MDIIDTIFELFDKKGSEAYLGEPVSQQEHALQAAYLATKDGASATLVVAALLHDVGHLVHGLGENIADQGIDGHHENVGANWLSKYVDASVTDPMKMHVAAKRYLCAVDHSYRDQLSPASIKSLELQGGAYNNDEVRTFEQAPHYQDAVRLRRWDDQAKIPGLPVPELSHYRPQLEAVFGSG